MTTGRINQVTVFPRLQKPLWWAVLRPGSICYESRGIVGKSLVNKLVEYSIGKPEPKLQANPTAHDLPRCPSDNPPDSNQRFRKSQRKEVEV